MAAFKRTKEPGNELSLKAGEAERRLRTIEKMLLDDLKLEEATKTVRMLARRAAEFFLLAESMASQLNQGHPISVELMGRNSDRLARTMKELRDQAVLVRIREQNAKVHAAMTADEDDDEVPPQPPRRPPPRATVGSPTPRRRGGIRRFVVDGEVTREI